VKLFDTTLQKLESSLDVRLTRQNVLAGNLANVDTPNYLPREVDFDKAMAAAQAKHAAGATTPVAAEGQIALSSVGPSGTDPDSFVNVAEGARGGLDGNGVDLDKTMVELSRNGLLYGAVAKATGKKLGILKYVASDGVG
jgi:flagellar basal-body rod protein FlgB